MSSNHEEPDTGMLHLYELLDKLNLEAERCIKNIEAIKSKGTKAVRKAECVLSQSIKQNVNDKSKQAVFQLIESLVEVNCNLELTDDGMTEFAISYIPIGNTYVALKFLSGESPWNFWLVDDKVDVKTLQKNLLKKYQNQLLDQHINPKPLESVCVFDRNKVFRGFVLQVINENRVKVLDCDSNITKVISSDKLFKTDPDACTVHASALRCTISKDSVDPEFWNADLRDVFCNALKEAVLHVKVIERLPGSVPRFLVDVEMISEEENSSGNLNDWIIGRLLPELKKLSNDNNELIYEFLSSESLNPYHKEHFEQFSENKLEVIAAKKSNSLSNNSTVIPELVTCQSEEFNNSNLPIDKVSSEILTNPDHSEDERTINDPKLITTSSDEGLVSSSTCGAEVTSAVSKDTDDGSENCSLDCFSNGLFPVKPNISPVKPTQSMPISSVPQKLVCSNYSQSVTYNFPQAIDYQAFCPNPYLSRPITPYPISPPTMYQVRPDTHSYPSSWGFQGANLQKLPNNWNHRSVPPGFEQFNAVQNITNVPQEIIDNKQKKKPSEDQPFTNSENDKNNDSVRIANINNISVKVNVLAPEFVPKRRNDYQENLGELKAVTDTSNIRSSSTPETPITNEDVHIELRKPRSLLTPGENFVVLIAHIESPSEFYVHFYTNSNKYIDKLNDDMFTFYTTKSKIFFNSWQEARNRLGKFCACKWPEDNHWYRVEILDYALGDNKVKVYFVDYGNTESVPLSHLQPLAQQFTKLSMCAQPCHLAKVHPLNKHEPWSGKSIEFFKSKVEVNNDKMYSITPIPSNEKAVKLNSLSVLLYEGKATENSYSINDMMVDYGMAWSKSLLNQSQSSESVYYSLDEMSPISEVTNNNTDNNKDIQQVSTLQVVEDDEDFENWDPQAEDYNSSRNNLSLDTDDPGVALVGYKARDEERICKFYAKKGKCWKGNICPKDHIMPNKDGVTTDKEEVYCGSFSGLTLPSVGEIIKVVVTAVSSISLFYVQLQEGTCFDDDQEDDEECTLTSLTHLMNSQENVMKMKHLNLYPALGEMVLARYDGMWYRARVMSAGEDDDPEVMFVDYGTICIVTLADLRKIEPRYLHLPFQAVECSLANIIPPEVGSEKHEKGTELLREAIQSFVLTAKVYESSLGDDDNRMALLLHDDELGDIGEHLVKNGCASKNELNWNRITMSYLSLPG